MLKASALYIVIILSLVIAILSASLITTAYFYRLEYQKGLRYTRLLSNLNSGFAILLSREYNSSGEKQIIDLFGNKEDSVALQKERWGAFELGRVESFSNSERLEKVFLMGMGTGKDPAALYLMDEDRPLSVSGTTEITGDAFLPKAGIKEAYVSGRSYKGKKLVYGNIKTSKNSLPELDDDFIAFIQQNLEDHLTDKPESLPDSVGNSFFNPDQVIHVTGEEARLNNKILHGRVILYSDTIVHIDKTSNLTDVIVYAPAIVMEEGFKGSCQLFAVDSIVTGKDCVFNYPSCFGVIKTKESINIQPKIVIGSNTKFSGVLFSHEENKTDLQTLIRLGKNSLIKGEIHANGLVRMDIPVKIHGKVTCKRFIIQTEESLYENYLIDVVINRSKRNSYYLSGSLFNDNKEDYNVMKWLE
jgi:hypothetical protein